MKNLLTLSVGLLVLVSFVIANPVPEPKIVEGHGNRGQADLRDPTGILTEKPYKLLKSCADCHREVKRGVTYFRENGTLISDGSAADLKAVEMFVAEQIHSKRTHTVWWVHEDGPKVDPEDLQDLRRALTIIHRHGLYPFTRQTWR